MTPREKLDAKVANEQLKFLANLLNALASAAVVGSLVAPIIAGNVASPFWSALVAGLGVLLHLVGQLILGFCRLKQ